MAESENVSSWFVGVTLVGILAAFAFAGEGDYQDAVEREARMAKLPQSPITYPVSSDPAKDFGPDYSKCITDTECEAIEAAWEAAHETNER